MLKDKLLIELGTEELPPKALRQLSEAFSNSIVEQLNAAELAFTNTMSIATPRRLGIIVENLDAEQADKAVEKRGPSVDVAFDADGNPTKAAEGWARSNGITVAEAQRLTTDKGEWLLHKTVEKGQPIASLLPAMVEKALKQLPIPKPMRWGNSSYSFIRPAHTYTAMFGSELIDASVLGIQSDRHIQGHRFHSPEGFELAHVNDYLEQLRSHYVMPTIDERKSLIKSEISRISNDLNGHVVEDEALLEEVAALVEWPVALHASFSEEFLQVPKQALIVTMKDDQRYFPVEDSQGNLLPAFIFITNIESRDPQQIILGNERVVRPRLADARFFFETDKKQTLESRLKDLENVLFQKRLGTIADKSERIAGLAKIIASELGVDPNVAYRAGLLSKADLTTQMVSEFPETQGVMGYHYALNDGESSAVAEAIEQHYWPRFAGDELPATLEACAVALADKLDTMVGIFGIGQTPKGDKDPFALRRAAIGILRIIVEQNLQLDLVSLIEHAQVQLGDRLTSSTVADDVLEFLLGRFRPMYQDKGIAVDVIQAVSANRPTRPADFDKRVRAVAIFKDEPEAESLAAANKRVGNILAKVDSDIPSQIDADKLQVAEEQTLAAKIHEAQSTVAPDIESGNYEAALKRLASLQQPIDAFFDNVMVNDDDPAIRANRLALLKQLRALFLEIADISLLQ